VTEAKPQQERENFSRGILTPAIKAQLVLFVVMTVAGITYVGANYVGLFKGIGSNACTVHVDLPDSGGLFSNAEVTYRGVTVGRVGPLRLIDKGVRADLDLDDCGSPRIPAGSEAIVSDRSVIGEQYLNLLPPPGRGGGPYLSAGDVIPMTRTKLPTSTTTLLRDMDALVTSVDVGSLRTTIDELGKAFSDRGADLGRLLQSTSTLVNAADQNLPTTIELIKASGVVLQTQLDEAGPLKSFSRDLALLSAQLKASDPDIRTLLDSGPSELGVISGFVQQNRTDLGATLANLVTIGDILVTRLDGLEQILILYPQVPASAPGIIQDGVERLGLVLNHPNDPPDCEAGYQTTDRRQPSDVRPKAPNVAATCTEPASSGINVRGSQNIPGGDPVSTSGGGIAYPRVATANVGEVRTAPTGAQVLGSRSWLAILTDALN
jgi:phospholipid/cholesterol/gamma-HCH transport system substrate-binding protein